jgi:hypothetical protein
MSMFKETDLDEDGWDGSGPIRQCKETGDKASLVP